AVQIEAPDGVSTRIYSRPSRESEILGIALNGAIHESAGTRGDFVEIVLPEMGVNGFVLKAHTKTWAAPKAKQLSPALMWSLGIGVGLVTLVIVILLWSRVKKTKVAEARAASIPASIKRAEELFRSGEYDTAVAEFKSFLDLHGGEVRNPDVYRRLSVCYQQLGEAREAARAWEKMRELGGVKGIEDYTLGVALMMALGKEAEAAQIYEQLLETEEDDERKLDIHTKLYQTYRRLKEPDKLIRHALVLMASEKGGEILGETVSFLITEGLTDAAIRSNNETIIKGVCKDLLEEKALSPAAARIFVKALEYNRTDKKLHGMLSQIYNQEGDYRRAVSELTILHQLDKGQTDEYIEQAAKIYIENSKVQEALSEGNPLIVKKMAQLYLARSEVNPDAVAVYEKVLEFQPKAVGINKMLSTVYLTRGDLEAYMSRLRLLHEIDGRNHDYLTDLAKCIIDNDLVEETIKEGNRDLNSKILKQLIKREASDDSAVSLFEKLARVEPTNAPIRTALVTAYEKRSQYDKLLEHALVLMGLKKDDKQLAEKVADIAVQHDLLGLIARSATGKALELTATKLVERRADSPESRQVLERALAQDPQNTVVKSYLRSIKPGIAPSPPGEPIPKSPPPREVRPRAEASATTRPAPDKPGTPDQGPAEPRAGQPKRTSPHAGEQRPPAAVSKKETQPKPKEDVAAQGRMAKPTKTAGIEEKQAPVKRPETRPPVGAGTPASLDFSELDFGEPARPSSGPARRSGQFVDITDKDVPFDYIAVTTFVSGYGKSLATQYKREELFVPATGGLAYKDMEVLFTDGWGDVHVGAEVNTARSCLLRVFRRDLVEEGPMFKEFIDQLTEVGFNVVHDSIMPLQEIVTGPRGEKGFVHPFFSQNAEMAVKSKRFSVDHALIIFERILDGLSYAHNFKGLDGVSRRTFHMHLQPSLVLVNDNYTECRIMNMGYSQVHRGLTRALKPRWQDPGMNPATMPPEFFRSKTTGGRERQSEIYSLGVLMYFMLTGHYPFEGPALDDYKFQHTRILAKPMQKFNPDVPDWLDQLVLKCLEKDMEKRWDSIADIQRELNQRMNIMGD
ncbi:MAG: tetratricopeptide repeat protein, partial [Deltaproteobacteria bacterium]|nr:tetratricopeptide repeat protein [Deltaproteobacteria bacterium]